MRKKQKTISVWLKEPNKAGRLVRVENELAPLQELVGGYIETFRIASDVTVIVNEEGLLVNSSYNMTICGVPLYGNIVIAGVRGEEFASVPEFDIDHIIPGFRKEGKQ